MNRPATRAPKYQAQHKHPPRILAKLDLFTSEQRCFHDTIRYFHGGMFAVFRSLGIRQTKDGAIYEAVQWQRVSERFSVVCWNSDGRGLSWTNHRTAATALRALRSAR